MYAYKDLQEVAGLTGRIYTHLSTLHNLPQLPAALTEDEDTFALKDVDVCVPVHPFASQLDTLEGKANSHNLNNLELVEKSKVIDSDALSGPSSTTLVRALTFTLRPGMHLMITGPNGVGKTAVARVLAGLWAPGSNSTLVRPTQGAGRQGVFVIPQRSYHPTGSLLSQVIYPQSVSEFTASVEALNELGNIHRAANLGYLVDRGGGWDIVKEWQDVLSGGEKQSLTMARLFYHRPKFATLDECTSAVSSDVEGRMYEYAKSLGIIPITISLRPSLTKCHTHLLTLPGDGTGSWTFSRIANVPQAHAANQETSRGNELTAAHEEESAVHLARVLDEILALEARIEESRGWEKRVKELEKAK